MIKAEIQKSSVPIVWIDTSVILNMTIAKKNPAKLQEVQLQRINNLTRNIREASRKGKVICPLANQEMEIWIDRDAWLDTIHDLGLGIHCVAPKTIQDIQLYAAIDAYSRSQTEITLSYLDMFDGDPVEELYQTLNQSVYVTVRNNVLFGAEYQKASKEKLLTKLNEQREKNASKGIKYQQQLEHELVGELEALLIALNDYASGNYEPDDHMNMLFGRADLVEQLDYLSYRCGKEQNISDLIKFYQSPYNARIPHTDISARMFAKIMVDPQKIKSGDPSDIEHAATMIPYIDLFITDKDWRTFLRREGLDKTYNTSICYIGDSEEIDDFFYSL
jgi:hypothetical protein